MNSSEEVFNESEFDLSSEDISFFKDLSLFFEHTPDLLCIANFNAQFKRVNPAVVQLLGYTQEELFSHSINYFVHPDDLSDTDKTRKEMFEGKPLINFENRYITKDGRVVWLSWTSITIPHRQLVFAIAKDITSRKKMEAEKNALFLRLEHINKELEYFAKVASHDLRAPIANILSLFDLLELDKIKDEDSLNIINLVKKSTERVYQTLEKYIDNLKNKEKIGTSKSFQNIHQITLAQIESIRSLIEQCNAKIDLDFSAFEEVLFNKEYLESIVLNLLTNAIKYSCPDRNTNIKLFTQIFEGKKQLIITDNGLGMDMELVKDKVFGFKQTFHNNDDGKGVGLFLVKSHIDEMEGTITLVSEPNKGSTFTITFKD